VAKTKLEKHMEELEEMTSGGAHDAVTFSGKGLGFLRDLFKSNKKRDEEEEPEEEEEEEETSEEDDEEDEDEEKKEKGKGRKAKKSMRGHAGAGKTSKEVNEETLEDEGEEEEDPGEGEEDTVIANKGKRVNTKDALGKSERGFDEVRFEKSMTEFESEYEDVLDASDALSALTGHFRDMAKSTNAGIAELQDSVRLLAKGLEQSLKAQAAMASDLELVKKQPVGAPPTGIFAMAKSQDGSTSKVSFYDVQDALTEAMNAGNEDAPQLLKSLSNISSNEQELRKFVKSLPDEVKEYL